MVNKESAAIGIGASDLLGVAFVILKLCDKIDWPWLWVLSPFWIPWAVFGAVAIVVGICLLIYYVVS